MSGANVHPHAVCQNCGAALAGPYCTQCGQHDIEYHRSLSHFLEDSLEGLFHLDGKALLSIRFLLTRPGFLTREFIAGRRVRYTNPLRFYIFASFLFFIITSYTAKVEVQAPPPRATPVSSAGLAGGEARGSPAAARPPSRFNEAMRRVKAMVHPEVVGSSAFSKELLHLVATALFICIPLLAFLLKLAYVRSSRVYVEHLIFALHIQTFVLFAILISEAIRWGLGLMSVALASFGQTIFQWLVLYLIYRAFRVVYQQGIPKTLLMMGAIAFSYFLIVGLTLVAVFIISTMVVARDTLPPG